MKQLQSIASFTQSHEAYISAGVLRENGIDSFIKNELTTQTYSLISDQLGGIQLQVDLKNVDEATKVLLDNGLIENTYSQCAKSNFLLSDYTTRLPVINKIPLQFQFVAFVMSLITIIFLTTIIYSLSAESKPREIDFYREKQNLIYEIMVSDRINPQEAIIRIQKLLDVKHDSRLYQLKSNIHMDLKEYENAISTLHTAKEHKKNYDINDYYNLAISYHKIGNHESSINTANEAYYKTKNDSDVGYIYEMIGELEQANFYYAKSLNKWLNEDKLAYLNADYKFMLNIMDSLSLEIKKNDELNN